MRPGILLSLLALLNTAQAQSFKTASLVAGCRSFELSPVSRTIPGFGLLETYFTTFDGGSGVPLYQRVADGAILSGEFRPRQGQPGVYEADYVTFLDDDLNEFGSVIVNLPTTDVDGNGLPDSSQRDRSLNTSFSGTLRGDWPAPTSLAITGQLSRSAGSTEGMYSATIGTVTGPITYNGILRVLHVSGTVEYSRSDRILKLLLNYVDADGRLSTLSGSTLFNVLDPNVISHPDYVLNSSDNRFYRVRAATLIRKGSKYVGNVELDDGGLSTSWRDYTSWVVEITDLNDVDRNGVPDLSDTEGFVSISAHPASQAAVAGQDVVFSVTAAGAPKLLYQWLFNGFPIPSATGPTLKISAVTAQSAGTYLVRVSNGTQTVESTGATLTVISPVGIATQPISQTVNVGESVTFSVTATGSTPMIFQWFKNGTPIRGANETFYRVTNVQSADAGVYMVTVSNSTGSINSAAATLNVRAVSTRLTLGELRFDSTSQIRIPVSGESGKTYQLEYSDDLLSWSRVTTIKMESSTAEFIHSLGRASHRFYRIRELPLEPSTPPPVQPANKPPHIVLTAPSPGTTVFVRQRLLISAAATDPDGRIARVEFFADQTKIGDRTSSPFTIQWIPLSRGAISIRAKAFDDKGATTESDPITITVR